MTLTGPIVTNLQPKWILDETTLHRSQTLVTIIIVNHNGREHLVKCIESILASTTIDYELIILDNASTDGSAEELVKHYPDINIILSEQNLGFCLGNNVAARKVTSKYLAFLNPDTVVIHGWLERLVEVLEDESRVGLVTPQILLMKDPETINTAGNDIHISGLTLCRGMGSPKDSLTEQRPVSAISGAAFVIREQLYHQLDGFDPEFYMYMEDTDLSLRAFIAGYDSVYIPTSIVYHDYRLRFSPSKVFLQERNRYLMLLKSLKWTTLVALMPAFLLAEIVTWGYVLLHDRPNWANKLKAYAYLFRHWPDIKRKRSSVQKTRRVSDSSVIKLMVGHLDFDQIGQSQPANIAQKIINPLFVIYRTLVLRIIRS